MTTETNFYKTYTYMIKSFKDVLTDNQNSVFFFIGNGLPYANGDTDIITIGNCVSCEESVWDSMIAAKKVFPNDVELIIPRKTWTTGRIYKDFDDKLDIKYLNEDDEANGVYAMYIMNSENNVYKCIFNNHGGVSTDEPIGDYTISDGFIQTTDNYIWKYMYNVKSDNSFMNDDWIPVPYLGNVYTSDIEYNIDGDFILEGTLSKIVVDEPGSGYVDSEIVVGPFLAGATYLEVISLEGVATNMFVSGTGIADGTYIRSISPEYGRLYLSLPTEGTGGTTNHPVLLETRIVVVGDGVECQASVNLNEGLGTVESIDVTLMGEGYTWADVYIYGTGTGASARAVLPQKYGHGSSPAIEFATKNVMIHQVMGEIDSTEGGFIPVDIKFRQYGLMVNPRAYGTSEILGYDTANAVYSQTMDVTLEAGSLYTPGELVYQGPSSAPTFYGYVLSQDYYTVRLVNFYGTPEIGRLLTNGIVPRPVTDVVTPGLEIYSGSILYVKNILPIERIDGQSEEIKIILEL